MKPEPASHSGASASPSRCLPDSIGLNTAGPRIAPNTAPNRTSAMPCARRSGGYMSPAAVRASRAMPLAIPISTNAVKTSTALSDAEPGGRDHPAHRARGEARGQHGHAPHAVHRPAGERRGERPARQHDGRPEAEQPVDPEHLHERDRGHGGLQLEHARVRRERGRQERRVSADRQVVHGGGPAYPAPVR